MNLKNTSDSYGFISKNFHWILAILLLSNFFLGFIMVIVLGFKGNEWAWKNNNWTSVERFKRVQRNCRCTKNVF